MICGILEKSAWYGEHYLGIFILQKERQSP